MVVVSIIIPVYNRKDLIDHTLKSIESQSFHEWECILIDDHSTDGTFEYLENFVSKDKRYRLFRRPDNIVKGGPSCRNYGYTKASGKYIQWFDSDDIMHPEMLEQKVERIERGGYDFVVCLLDEFEGTETRIVKYNTKSDTPAYSYLTGQMYFFTPGPLFSKDFLDRKVINLFKEDLKRHQEWEFYFRVVANSTNYFALNKVLIHRRIHTDSLAKKVDQSVKAEYHLLSRISALKFLNRKQLRVQKSFSYLLKNARFYIYKSATSRNFKALGLALTYLYLINVNMLTAKKEIA